MLALAAFTCAVTTAAGEPAVSETIDTSSLEAPWPHQLEREIEVGRENVVWRQRGSRKEGIFAGIRFQVPVDRPRAWALANDYSDVGSHTEGIRSVRVIEEAPGRRRVLVEAEVLWITLRLDFEIEEKEPESIRFRLRNPEIGEYTGYCRFEPAEPKPEGGQATSIEFATRFKPVRPIPIGLALLAERMVLLRGVRAFLETVDKSKAKAILHPMCPVA